MIKNLTDLIDFLRRVAAEVPGILHVLPIENAEEGVDDIQAYYERDYAGTTLFIQVAEIERQGDNRLTFFSSLIVAEKPAETSAAARLAARDNTMQLLLALIGRLELAQDESLQTVEATGDAYTVELAVHRDTLLPIGRLANVDLRGWYVDVDVVIPANHLLYPNG